MNTIVSHIHQTVSSGGGDIGVPDMDTIQAYIKDSPIGENLSDEECRRLAETTTYRRLENNEYLIEDGEVDDSLHVVVSGKLGVVKYDQGGECVTFHVLNVGDIAGEMGFIDGTAHSAGLRAMTDCGVVTLHRDSFERLMLEYPMLGYNVMRAIIRTVHVILRRMNFQHLQLTNYVTKQHGRY
jgi:CRP-like cAMP-binding protein